VSRWIPAIFRVRPRRSGRRAALVSGSLKAATSSTSSMPTRRSVSHAPTKVTKRPLGRRVIVVAGGRSVRSRCASCGCADAQGSGESRNHARRGGNRGRQFGDILCLDTENAEPSRHSERLACGCWTGTYYTSGSDAYPTPLRPVTQPHGQVPKRVPKSPRQARSG
jgi:hypothetical protein